MSLSCFTTDYRKKDHAWAIIGFVMNFSEGKGKGKQRTDRTHLEKAHISGKRSCAAFRNE